MFEEIIEVIHRFDRLAKMELTEGGAAVRFLDGLDTLQARTAVEMEEQLRV